jgi:hypothetical protein
VTGWGSRVLVRLASALLVLLAAASGGPAYAADPAVPSTTLFYFADDDIFESSGLVDRGDVVYTVNDSGDDAVVYGVDPASGRTGSRTTYADDAEDVEALAPGASGTVWVGDTGDNRRRRDDIAVYRVRPVDGERPGERFDLVYPDGPHDAEALLVEPRTQRVFVVSKSAFGGTVYAAPPDLVAGDEPNRMRAYAQVRGLVTDGAFFPDGKHVVLRTYGQAMVYTFPAFGLVGTVRLPSQPQGEGISVGADGRVLVSTEGVHADVRQVRLPASLTAPRPPGRAPSPPPLPSDRAAGAGEQDPAGRPSRDGWDWAGIGLVALGVAGLGYLTVSVTRSHRAR